MLCCQKRKSNYFVQVEGDFCRDLTRKIILGLQEFCFFLCPLIIPVTLYLTFSCSGCVLPVSFGTLHTQLTFKLITVATKIISLRNSFPHSEARSLVLPWGFFAELLLYLSWESQDVREIKGPSCHHPLFIWKALLLKLYFEFSIYSPCYGLDVCVTFPWLGPNPWCDDIWRWVLWERLGLSSQKENGYSVLWANSGN